MPSNLRHDHPQMSTMTRWHSYVNIIRIPWTGNIRDVRK